jgi:hypothetical protein
MVTCSPIDLTTDMKKLFNLIAKNVCAQYNMPINAG